MPGLYTGDFAAAKIFLGLAFTGFSLFWTGMAWWITGQAGLPLLFRLFPLFGVPFVLIGLRILGVGGVWRAYERRYTWYTLTNRRAFIATALPLLKRSLKSWPIAPTTEIEFDGNTPGTLIFAYENRGQHGKTPKPIGFIRLPDPLPVLRLMHQTRKRQMI
ncbi:hypothetical protein N4R57_03890 [Rhodobacteraceae bacterium D3-12]|nr:hypothetical protein N4R57_03890 [Rhodobacteraceae bacterium D3-12]